MKRVKGTPCNLTGQALEDAELADLVDEEGNWTEKAEQPTLEEMMAELKKLQDENAKLKEAGRTKNGLKVSDKGGVSVYGIQRFPVTLYKSQWDTLLAMADDIKAFIAKHAEELAVKE